MLSVLTDTSTTAMDKVTVTDLYRFAVKGLGADSVEQVTICQQGETFPDDRRFALMKTSKLEEYWAPPVQPPQEGTSTSTSQEWVHKENFLCAYTAPTLMAGFLTSYKIVSAEPHMSRCLPSDAPVPSSSDNASTTQRLLEIHNRSTGQHLLGPVDLAKEEGREALASFLSAQSGQDVTCVSVGSESNDSKTKTVAHPTPHTHQFGNTHLGVKVRGDTRTLHIVNLATIRDLSEKIGVELNPYRFRPNIVIDGPPAWSEFGWVGKNLVVMDSRDGKPTGMKLAVIQKTVRCEATHVDPTDPEDPYPEIVKLLIKHFPKHGPFLGVYAVVDEPGSLALGQEFKVVD
jgi:uncharacterized protein YcbX